MATKFSFVVDDPLNNFSDKRNQTKVIDYVKGILRIHSHKQETVTIQPEEGSYVNVSFKIDNSLNDFEIKKIRNDVSEFLKNVLAVDCLLGEIDIVTDDKVIYPGIEDRENITESRY